MKKLILSLAMAAMAPFAFAQTVDVQTHTDGVQTRTRARTHETARPEPRREVRQEQTTEQRTERTVTPDVRLTFKNRDRGFIREHGPGFWRARERHDRAFYIRTFGEPNMRFINGCWYYRYGDCFWPAFGYDPDCAYPNGEEPICD